MFRIVIATMNVNYLVIRFCFYVVVWAGRGAGVMASAIGVLCNVGYIRGRVERNHVGSSSTLMLLAKCVSFGFEHLWHVAPGKRFAKPC